MEKKIYGLVYDSNKNSHRELTEEEDKKMYMYRENSWLYQQKFNWVSNGILIGAVMYFVMLQVKAVIFK